MNSLYDQEEVYLPVIQAKVEVMNLNQLHQASVLERLYRMDVREPHTCLDFLCSLLPELKQILPIPERIDNSQTAKALLNQHLERILESRSITLNQSLQDYLAVFFWQTLHTQALKDKEKNTDLNPDKPEPYLTDWSRNDVL